MGPAGPGCDAAAGLAGRASRETGGRRTRGWARRCGRRWAPTPHSSAPGAAGGEASSGAGCGPSGAQALCTLGVPVGPLTARGSVASKMGAVTLGSRQARAARPRSSCGSCRAGRLLPQAGPEWVAGSWGGQERPEGLVLPGEPAHLPFPWGIVLGALGALLPPPGALVSGSTAETGRAFVRRPLLGRSLLRGSVFRPFSWKALLVILTPESCRRKRGIWVVFSPPSTQDQENPALGILNGANGGKIFANDSCISDSGGWGGGRALWGTRLLKSDRAALHLVAM